MFESLFKSDKQRLVFANKLAEMPALGSYAPSGMDYKQYGEHISQKLLDPEEQKFYLPYLEKLSFKSS